MLAWLELVCVGLGCVIVLRVMRTMIIICRLLSLVKRRLSLQEGARALRDPLMQENMIAPAGPAACERDHARVVSFFALLLAAGLLFQRPAQCLPDLGECSCDRHQGRNGG